MRCQRGQVLPIGLALLVFGSLGAFVLFNTGQVATEKMKLANTADAAAYSGSLWQARALNFQSYTNRAMVANQVSIAQAVTLRSWVAYGAIASENIATVLKPVPVLNVLADGLQRGLDVVERVVSPVAQAMLSVVDIVNRGLSKAQQAMYISTFIATPDVMRTVVKQTDERFTINTAFSGLGLALNLNQWRTFTSGFSDENVDAMDERVQMINDSRDAFSRQRNWKFFNFWFYSPPPLLKHQMRREGTTKLIRVEGEDGTAWEWKAKDTLSLHGRMYTWKGKKRYEVPVGWAEAFANTLNSSSTIEQNACKSKKAWRRGGCARFLGINRKGEYLADIGSTSLTGQQSRIAMKHYTGVQAYRSLSQATRDKEQPRIRLKVEVSLAQKAIRTTEALGFRGQVEAPVQAPGEVVTSISVAEVFYRRPDEASPNRVGQSLEPANGYNPYWSARLSPIDSNDRSLAFALRAKGQGSYVPANGSSSLPERPVELSSYAEATAGDVDLQNVSTAADGHLLIQPFLSDVGDFNSVVAAQDTGDLSQYRHDIESALVNVLRDQVGQILSGVIGGSSGSSIDSVEDLKDELQQMAIDEIGDLASESAAAPYVQVVQEATMVAEKLEDEFRAIRDTIIDEFQVVYEEFTAALKANRQALIDKREELQSRLNSYWLKDEDIQVDIRREIKEIDLELKELVTDYRDDLAHSLRKIVNEATDLYTMRLSEAYYLVDEFLRVEEESISIPWLDWVDEEDIDEEEIDD